MKALLLFATILVTTSILPAQHDVEVNGRQARLYPDGTWEYIDEIPGNNFDKPLSELTCEDLMEMRTDARGNLHFGSRQVLYFKGDIDGTYLGISIEYSNLSKIIRLHFYPYGDSKCVVEESIAWITFQNGSERGYEMNTPSNCEQDFTIVYENRGPYFLQELANKLPRKIWVPLRKGHVNVVLSDEESGLLQKCIYCFLAGG